MNDPIQQLFEILTGFSVEMEKDSIIIKVEKDALIKKVLTRMQMHKLGFEYHIDEKYVVFKMPLDRYGKEVVSRFGLK